MGAALARRRRGVIIGRTPELELFRAALDGADTGWSVLAVHGPGGIGKTTLLAGLAELAATGGAALARLDGRELGPSTESVTTALQAVGVDFEDDDGPITAGARLVVLVDGYEQLQPLDDWFRTSLLPRLPADALTVLAGRDAPGPAWRADAAWRGLLRVVSL
ncbi:MAG: AAA family ATPase, partial [Thermocrispum sp.]